MQVWFRLAYSNLWIALSAGAQVYVNFRLLSAQAIWQPVLLATLAMFWVYTFAKAVHFDPAADAANDPDRTAFLKAHRTPLIVTALAGLLLGSWLAASHGAAVFGLFWTPTLIGLLYDLRFLPPSFRYRRLKDVPGLKGSSVALAWATLCVGLPAGFGVSANSDAWLVLYGWNVCMWFVNTTYFDLGDLAGDRLEGTRTLPVALGYGQTRRLLHFLNILSGLCLWLAVATGLLDPLGLRLLALHLVQAVLLFRARDEDCDISFECDIAFDGIFVFAALCLLW